MSSMRSRNSFAKLEKLLSTIKILMRNSMRGEHKHTTQHNIQTWILSADFVMNDFGYTCVQCMYNCTYIVCVCDCARDRRQRRNLLLNNFVRLAGTESSAHKKKYYYLLLCIVLCAYYINTRPNE